MSVRMLREEVKTDFGINVSMSQCRRANKYALSLVEGTIAENYARLWSYGEEIRRSNPGSTVKICVDSMPDGELLCAVGRDAKNGIFSIAWAVVSVENKDKLEMGLIAAVKEVFLAAEHRQCARHIYANFRKRFSGSKCPEESNNKHVRGHSYICDAKDGDYEINRTKMEWLFCIGMSFLVGGMKFEARKMDEAFTMDVEEKECSCRLWQLNGYACPIHGMNGKNMWPSTDLIPHLPPLKRHMPGRPTIKRRRDASERMGNHTVSMAGKKVSCSISKEKGHNKATCSKGVGTSKQNGTKKQKTIPT
ncbi:uncharacterized protein LOC111880046 [Lactuca sativa]|uniref:uncharacterized protein LOC111880046 n=1 Tax=Lactuca sativa TaxID=4236 RepID=UPI000CD9C541|nr:uncharacterized protein LOC111880046 [Lactuca sativa]